MSDRIESCGRIRNRPAQYSIGRCVIFPGNPFAEKTTASFLATWPLPARCRARSLAINRGDQVVATECLAYTSAARSRNFAKQEPIFVCNSLKFNGLRRSERSQKRTRSNSVPARDPRSKSAISPNRFQAIGGPSGFAFPKGTRLLGADRAIPPYVFFS